MHLHGCMAAWMHGQGSNNVNIDVRKYMKNEFEQSTKMTVFVRGTQELSIFLQVW